MSAEEHTLEKLKIHERLGEVEQTVARIESRLFEDGIVTEYRELMKQFGNHIIKDEKEYGEIRSVKNGQRIVIALFSVMVGGVLWKVFF